jgi:hypothetical protein
MSVKPFTQKLEITFWATIIPIMSESTLVRRVVRVTYRLAERVQSFDNISSAVIISMLGLIIGFVLGMMHGLI